MNVHDRTGSPLPTAPNVTSTRRPSVQHPRASLSLLPPRAEPRCTVRLVFSALAVSLGMMQFGYHIAELSSSQYTLTCADPADATAGPAVFGLPACIQMSPTFDFGVLSAMLSVGGFAGSLSTATYIAARLGRRRALMVGGVASAVAPVLLAGASRFWMMVVARILSGVGAGIAATINAAYLADLAPPAQRALYGSLAQVMLNFGLFVCSIMNTFFTPAPLWRLIMLTPVAFAAIQLALLPSTTPSPRDVATGLDGGWITVPPHLVSDVDDAAERRARVRIVLAKLWGCPADDRGNAVDLAALSLVPPPPETKVAVRVPAEPPTTVPAPPRHLHVPTPSEHVHHLHPSTAAGGDSHSILAASIHRARRLSVGPSDMTCIKDASEATRSANGPWMMRPSMASDSSSLGSSEDEDVSNTLIEMPLVGKHAVAPPAPARVSVWQFLTAQKYRRSMWIVALAHFSLQASGITLYFSYSYSILTLLLAPRTARLVFSASIAYHVVALLVCGRLTDVFGRRPMLLAAYATMGVAAVVLHIGALTSTPALALAGFMGAVTGFALGMGSVPYILIAEVVDPPAIAAAAAVALAVNWGTQFVYLVGFLPLLAHVRSWVFVIIGAITLVGGAVAARIVPETKGRSGAEVLASFQPVAAPTPSGARTPSVKDLVLGAGGAGAGKLVRVPTTSEC
ncbi:hypothetical protein AMAG_04341 [Allomyces macrogynus ATCC 38327]|uniref:Major facilitator superfamily (MFS) profile domain-containing protein n=1 Tax=Allomyces macrogynus (strain ATCC 38327) TaxID=578462 RepID=A0A0L0S8Q8_ALLM3|nr:hypothetical protein AMAG_04341 [Allomyces macrogynus ATCC 38327]|eukprot:KNE58790.1 hypothetical protein AMAG_04341 [Allomyces macrogynus ATCC 38327]